MQLYHSPHSPFSLKVATHAAVLGLSGQITICPANGSPLKVLPDFRRMNPSGQIPVLVTQDGEPLFDAQVICGYLSAQAGGDLASAAHFLHRRDEAVGDTMAEAALAYRYETAVRPEALRWPEWREAWLNKITDATAWLEARAEGFGARRDIGVIAVYCALKFICERMPNHDWRAAAPKLAQWYAEFAADPVIRAAAA